MQTAEAAQYLGVSTATVRNWIKAGLLPAPLSNQSVEQLRHSIQNGQVERLNKRANKGASARRFIPSEYAGSTSSCIAALLNISHQFFDNIPTTLYHLVLCFLQSQGEFSLDSFSFKRNIFRQILVQFEDCTIQREFVQQTAPLFDALLSHKDLDVLGLLYQSLLSEGSKSQAGSYYTPISIVREMLQRLSNDVQTFLDPCCGTGSFLLQAARLKQLALHNIYGADSDRNAVLLAKVNLLCLFPDYQNEPNIYCVDSLRDFANDELFCSTRFLPQKIDAIATNPPWGAGKNINSYGHLAQVLGSKEVFSMFVFRSLQWIKNGGECAFLLPDSFLNIKAHRYIRQILCRQTCIQTICSYRRAFAGVFTSVIALHFKKELPETVHRVQFLSEKQTQFIPQVYFANAVHSVFDVNTSNQEREIIEQIYATPHQTLRGKAFWALGIVTGDNQFFLKSEPNTPKDEPIYRGGDVEPFRLNQPSGYIYFDKSSLQQVAREELYRMDEKLVYRFISNRLVFAYDASRCLTLNSANVLIPRLEGYTAKTALALLNSELFQFLFSRQFNTHKVLRSHLERLPFPYLSDRQAKELTELVDRAIAGENVQTQIDNVVYGLFGIGRG